MDCLYTVHYSSSETNERPHHLRVDYKEPEFGCVKWSPQEQSHKGAC